MDISQRDVERIGVLALIVALAVLVFIILKPIVLSILAGLILAYALLPFYRVIEKRIKNRTASSAIISILMVTIIVIPSYYVIPIMVNQVFNLFEFSQTLDIHAISTTLFPTASEQFVVQLAASFNGVVAELTSIVLNSLVNLLLETPTIMFHLFIVAFVFFYALRDRKKLGEFVASLSPLNKIQEHKLIKQFRDITNSIVYGQIVIGIVQGLIAGIGFYLFGLPNFVIFTALAMAFSVIPILGPLFVWLPIAMYLLATGEATTAFLFILYNIFLVSNVDNLLRLYFISRKTKLSQVVVLVGMTGGLLIFGILGILLGPLILAYFIIFLEAYRKDELSSLFKPEKKPK
jgi:predicted PurR-regulated permease PerM